MLNRPRRGAEDQRGRYFQHLPISAFSMPAVGDSLDHCGILAELLKNWDQAYREKEESFFADKILSDGQSLFSLAAVAVGDLDELRAACLFPKRFGQTPLKYLRAVGWGTAFDGLDDVFELPEVLLPNTSAASVFTRPLRIVIVSMPVDLLGFEPFHDSPPCPAAARSCSRTAIANANLRVVWGASGGTLGHTKERFNTNFLAQSASIL